VSQLRKALGNGALITRTPGYELRLEDEELDLERFERLLEEGKNARLSGRVNEAATKLREALSLWRGAPLADFTYEPFAQSEIARLEELHLNALEERIEADLALGRQADLIGELEALAKQHELRERPRAQLMLALYRCGRQAEALDLYQQTRRLLRDELGLEPGPDLQELEKAILRQDADLAGPRPESFGISPVGALRRPRTLIVVGLVLLLAAVAAGLIKLTRGSGPGGLPGIAPDALGAIDPKTNRIVAQVPVGARPAQLAYALGALWVVNQGDNTISRVDPIARAQVRTIPLGAVPSGLTAARGSIWVTTDKGVKLIDPAFTDLTRTIKIREPAPNITSPFVTSPTGIAFTRGAGWVINGDWGGHLLRVDTKTGRKLNEIPVGNDPAAIASSGGDLWVTDAFDNTVSRIDRTGAVTAPIKVGRAPTSVAVGGGAVWVADSADDDVKRIDPDTGTVLTTVRVGHSPSAIAIAAGAVWVASRDDGTISRVDPHSNKVVAKIKVGGSPIGLALARGLLWVSVQAKPPLANSALESQGGVAQIDWGPFSIDPASQDTFNALSAQLEYATCAKLLNYPDKPAREGSRLQPEVAESMPTISPDGKTYTFTIRNGYRFSPPSNQPVTAATFKYTIERSLSPKLKSPASQYLSDIVGEQPYLKGKAAHIAGVSAHAKTLSIRLTHVAGDLPARLAMPFFCAVPTNTPMHLTEAPPIPTAGPYYIASYIPGAQTVPETPAVLTVLKRNPNYTGPRLRRLAEIIYAGGYSSEHSTTRSVARVIAGETDYVPVVGGIEVGAWSLRGKLNRRYGANSPAARAGHQQAFLNPTLFVDALTLNTSRGLFADARLRRAVNYAIDRRALARLGGFGFAGPLTATPTDQYLPPDFPGFKDVEIYPLDGDLRRAKQLAGGRGRTAVMYTCDFPPCPEEAQLVKRTLAALGITVEVRTFAMDTVLRRELRKREPFDIGLVTWRFDYVDPFDFLNLAFDGNLGPNWAQFDDPAWNHRLEEAARLSGKRRYRAYARLDADLARHAAPWIAFENDTRFDFFSARVGCQTYQPIYGMDLTTLCVRSKAPS
jgi:YVTN family beta-propeller protein